MKFKNNLNKINLSFEKPFPHEMKTTFRVETQGEQVLISEQKAGQFVNPRIHSGLLAKAILWMINKYFLRA